MVLIVGLILSFHIFFGLNAEASVVLDSECWKSARDQHFLLRGPEASDYPGARLWNLYRIAHFVKEHPEDVCIQSVFQKARDDQNKYWNYIGSKYRCRGGAESGRKSKPACESFALNRARIRLISSFQSSGQKKTKNASRSVDCNVSLNGVLLREQDQKLLQEGAQVIEKIADESGQEDVCLDVPQSQRRKPDEVVLSWENEFYCDNAANKEFAIGIADIFFLGKKAKQALESDDFQTEAEWDPSSAVSAAVQKATHPKEVKESWWKSFIADQKENILPGFDCYTSKFQVAAVCKAIGGGLASLVEWSSVYTGVRSMLAKTLVKKLGSKATREVEKKAVTEEGAVIEEATSVE